MRSPDENGMSEFLPASLTQLVTRALTLRCPRCGARGVMKHWFAMQHACARCGQTLERGESSDYWLGAYVINLVVAEGSVVVVALVMWMVLGDGVSFNVLWAASMLLAVVMPVLFYPFSRTLWLALDLHFRPSEAGDVEHSRAAPPGQRR